MPNKTQDNFPKRESGELGSLLLSNHTALTHRLHPLLAPIGGVE